MTKWQLSESGIVSCLGLMPRFALWDVPSRKLLMGVWVSRSSGVRDRSYCSRRPLAGWRGTGFSAIPATAGTGSTRRALGRVPPASGCKAFEK